MGKRECRSTPLKGLVWEPKQPDSRRAMMRVLPISCRMPPVAIRIILPNAETLITFTGAEHWLSYFRRPLARMGCPLPPFSAEPARPFPVCAHPHSRPPERPMLTGGGICRLGRKRDDGGCPTQRPINALSNETGPPLHTYPDLLRSRSTTNAPSINPCTARDRRTVADDRPVWSCASGPIHAASADHSISFGHVGNEYAQERHRGCGSGDCHTQHKIPPSLRDKQVGARFATALLTQFCFDRL